MVLRKSILFLVFAACALALIGGAAFAEEKIGVLDPQEVLLNHPKFQDTQKQIQQVVQSKQNEAKMAIDATSNKDEQAKIYRTKRQEAAAEEQKLMQPLFKDIDLAIRTVAKAKGLTIVLDKNQVFFGGMDITNDVIQELKKQSATKK
ncbi:OmpH family outer membrane protein [Acetomicrobium sp. S15 = DSM 107314]|jgi:outer membrane protein|uniref:OmpH family outer membrane protein n=1 Tax=Acetomicrobium sp. S15 = DSM 107314 TaxID=2529858 RepID=UPI0018E11403|nr:OmpH family outer membrane protein [Acetomicrobium sp. S15 = DSM 107314]